FSRGGRSVFRRWASGDFSAAKASRSWQASFNMFGYPSPRFGPWLEFCGEGSTGNPRTFHEPWEPPPGFGVRQSFRLCGAPKRRSGATAAGALAMEASQPKAPEDWRSPRRYRAIHRFTVPMHAQKRQRTAALQDAIARARPVVFGLRHSFVISHSSFGFL